MDYTLLRGKINFPLTLLRGAKSPKGPGKPGLFELFFTRVNFSLGLTHSLGCFWPKFTLDNSPSTIHPLHVWLLLHPKIVKFKAFCSHLACLRSSLVQILALYAFCKSPGQKESLKILCLRARRMRQTYLPVHYPKQRNETVETKPPKRPKQAKRPKRAKL